MNKELDTLIAVYKENASKHGKAIVEGDYNLANESHDLLIQVLIEIRKHDEEGAIALASIIQDKDDSVKCWAATHSLSYDQDKSEKALLDLSEKKGPIAFNAEMVLSEWKKGTLEIP
jgi:hypothetical protein